MKVTILIDLDDTLLGGVSEHFMPEYVRALCRQIHEVPADVIVKELFTAIKLMEGKKYPAQTMEQVFDSSFYPGIGLEKEYLRDRLDHFYANEFADLRKHTYLIPEAVDFIQSMMDQGNTVVIATNPLFPGTATYQRLEWAGLSKERYPFALITTYEHSHFAKPQPSYYAEILAQLGWPENQAVMIGDRFDRDISPADRLGLPTYWISDPGSDGKSEYSVRNPRSAKGSIRDLKGWIERISDEVDPPPQLCGDIQVQRLASSPAAIQAMTAKMNSSLWDKKLNVADCSIKEIVSYLCDLDRYVNIPRLTELKNRQSEKLFLPALEITNLPQKKNSCCDDPEKIIAEYMESRMEVLAIIEDMDCEQLGQPVQHAIFGTTLPHELLGFMVQSDQMQIRRIAKILNNN